MPFAVRTDLGRRRIAPARPAGVRQRFGTGNVGFGDVAAIVLLGTAACSGGLLVLDRVLVDRPSPAAAVAPATPAEGMRFGARDLGAYVGHWISERGAHLIVAKSGAVWADGGAMLGTATLDTGDRTRLLFSGPGFRCAYSIRAERSDALVWRIDEASQGTTCPAGRYSRQATF